MSHCLAEDLLVGWLGEREYSWRVVAGQNAAYDQFPCQYQIFYRGKARGSVWYDPVFMVRVCGFFFFFFFWITGMLCVV